MKGRKDSRGCHTHLFVALVISSEIPLAGQLAVLVSVTLHGTLRDVRLSSGHKRASLSSMHCSCSPFPIPQPRRLAEQAFLKVCVDTVLVAKRCVARVVQVKSGEVRPPPLIQVEEHHARIETVSASQDHTHVYQIAA